MIRIHLDLPDSDYALLLPVAEKRGITVGALILDIASAKQKRPTGRQPSRFTPDQEAKYLELRALGWSDQEIAPRLRLTIYQLRSRRERLGLAPTSKRKNAA